ncbi:MAG: YbaK/EbsC family protein [Chloroflexota bacterium]
MPSNPVTLALDQLGIHYRLHLHPQPVRSLEQAAAERGLAPDQIVRSLVFRLEDGSFALLLMPGRAKASWPKLRRTLGVNRLTTATPDEVRQATGYEPGAVSPFGLPQPLRLLADVSLLKHDWVSIGAGIHNAGVILHREDMVRALRPEVGDFGEEATGTSGGPSGPEDPSALQPSK